MMTRAVVLALVLTLVTACGGGSGPAESSLPGTPTLNSLPVVPPEAMRNELSIYVDAGPADTGYNVNRLYTDVTVCYPGRSSPGSPTQCQTIKHVLVDTGSTGLRLLSRAMAPDLNLSGVTAGGFQLLNCAKFVDDSSAWGPVAMADIVLGGKTAASVPIQVIGDPVFNSLATASPSPCSGTATTTAKDLGANGIIGLGLFKEDCGTGCATIVNNGFYYTCTDASCAATKGATASIAQQVKNPVPLFATDNNGLLINLPEVTSPGAPTLDGTLIFGIGTQSNNQLTSGTVLTTNDFGYITTEFAGKSLNTSFIDTGSNGLYFDSSTIPSCSGSSTGFYCPTSRATLSATLRGANAVTALIPFSVDNASALFVGASNNVLPTLAGTIGDPNTFDWGLPFFYGRRVFIGIEGMTPSLTTGSFYAF
jgi:hypothetical protein